LLLDVTLTGVLSLPTRWRSSRDQQMQAMQEIERYRRASTALERLLGNPRSLARGA
jgi:hypothetical protein